MRAPIRPLSGRWPTLLERRLGRFFWADPTVVLDDEADPDTFRTAMNAFSVGSTIKITGTNRHSGANDLLMGLDLSQAVAVLGMIRAGRARRRS